MTLPVHPTHVCSSVPVKWPESPEEGDTFAYLCPISGVDWVFYQWRDDLFGWSYLGTG